MNRYEPTTIHARQWWRAVWNEETTESLGLAVWLGRVGIAFFLGSLTLGCHHALFLWLRKPELELWLTGFLLFGLGLLLLISPRPIPRDDHRLRAWLVWGMNLVALGAIIVVELVSFIKIYG